MYYSETEIKRIKSKDQDRNTACWPQVSGGQSGVTKSKGLYNVYLCDGDYLITSGFQH